MSERMSKHSGPFVGRLSTTLQASVKIATSQPKVSHEISLDLDMQTLSSRHLWYVRRKMIGFSSVAWWRRWGQPSNVRHYAYRENGRPDLSFRCAPSGASIHGQPVSRQTRRFIFIDLRGQFRDATFILGTITTMSPSAESSSSLPPHENPSALSKAGSQLAKVLQREKDLKRIAGVISCAECRRSAFVLMFYEGDSHSSGLG